VCVVAAGWCDIRGVFKQLSWNKLSLLHGPFVERALRWGTDGLGREVVDYRSGPAVWEGMYAGEVGGYVVTLGVRHAKVMGIR
jgi:hypothetical protein